MVLVEISNAAGHRFTSTDDHNNDHSCSSAPTYVATHMQLLVCYKTEVYIIIHLINLTPHTNNNCIATM